MAMRVRMSVSMYARTTCAHAILMCGSLQHHICYSKQLMLPAVRVILIYDN